MQEEDAARQVLALDLIEKGEATENQLTREGVHQALQSEAELFHLLFSGPTAVLRGRVGKEGYRRKIEIWAAMAIARNFGLDNEELEELIPIFLSVIPRDPWLGKLF